MVTSHCLNPGWPSVRREGLIAAFCECELLTALWVLAMQQIWTLLINSLWPSDAIWRHISGSTLVQVMACCLTAPSHHLNQHWLIINEVLWFTLIDQVDYNELENYNFKTTATPCGGQWVNPFWTGHRILSANNMSAFALTPFIVRSSAGMTST